MGQRKQMYRNLGSIIQTGKSKALERFQRTIARLAMAHYHEFPVKDSDGNIIGYEFFTTRGTTVVFVPRANLDSEEPKPSDRTSR